MDRDHILSSLRERILAFATSRVSREQAEDLTQEVLIVLHEKYAQIAELKAVGASPLQFQFPDRDSNSRSIKIVAGQRQIIPLSRERGPVSLFVRLFRVLQEPLTKEETLLHDHRDLDRLRASSTIRETVTREEYATYAVN